MPVEKTSMISSERKNRLKIVTKTSLVNWTYLSRKRKLSRKRAKRPAQNTTLKTAIISRRSRDPVSSAWTWFLSRHQRSRRKARADWAGGVGGAGGGVQPGAPRTGAATGRPPRGRPPRR